eukprot:4057077-Pyramimonas_sp.AAC.1
MRLPKSLYAPSPPMLDPRVESTTYFKRGFHVYDPVCVYLRIMVSDKRPRPSMIHLPIPWLISYIWSCLPSRDELWDASKRRRRCPKSRVLSLLRHGQALYPYLSLGSGAGYIFMWLALTS